MSSKISLDSTALPGHDGLTPVGSRPGNPTHQQQPADGPGDDASILIHEGKVSAVAGSAHDSTFDAPPGGRFSLAKALPTLELTDTPGEAELPGGSPGTGDGRGAIDGGFHRLIEVDASQSRGNKPKICLRRPLLRLVDPDGHEVAPRPARITGPLLARKTKVPSPHA